MNQLIDDPLGLDFDRRLKLEFLGSRINCDAGILAYREFDDALGFSSTAGDMLGYARTDKSGRPCGQRLLLPTAPYCVKFCLNTPAIPWMSV